jgi:Cu+-exporting ATPase
LESAGKTAVWIAINGEMQGLIAIADALKPSSEVAVRALQKLGLEVVMLTGDNAKLRKRSRKKLASAGSLQKYVQIKKPQLSNLFRQKKVEKPETNLPLSKSKFKIDCGNGGGWNQ